MLLISLKQFDGKLLRPWLFQTKQRNVDSGGSRGPGRAATDCEPSHKLRQSRKLGRGKKGWKLWFCTRPLRDLKDKWAEDAPVHFSYTFTPGVSSVRTLDPRSYCGKVSLEEAG